MSRYQALSVTDRRVDKRTDKGIICEEIAYKGSNEPLCLLLGDRPSVISISSFLSLGRQTPLRLWYWGSE